MYPSFNVGRRAGRFWLFQVGLLAGLLVSGSDVRAIEYRADATFPVRLEGVDGAVTVIAPAPGGGFYVGGFFTTIAGEQHPHLARFNADGTIDSTFNAAGGFNSAVYAIAVQSDGRIVVGGAFSRFNGAPHYHLVRLNTDGSLDNSFDPAAFDDVVYAIAIQADGRILVGGAFDSFEDEDVNFLVRLNANGTTDTGFWAQTFLASPVRALVVQGENSVFVAREQRIDHLNSSGVRLESYESIDEADFRTLVCQPEGGIIVGGAIASNPAVVRFDENGTRDLAFNASGEFDAFEGTVHALALQSDGQIVVGGFFESFDGVSRPGILRLDSNGALDTEFDPGDGANEVIAISVKSDDRLIIGGYFDTYDGDDAGGLARLASDGALEAAPSQPLRSPGQAYCAAVLPDGKVLVAGDFDLVNGSVRGGIARLNADGTVDPAFDPGIGFDDPVWAIALQSDGRIIVAGEFEYFDDVDRNSIARLNTDGSLDFSFDPGTGFEGQTMCAAVQNDGRIIVGGYFEDFNGTERSNIARLNTDGSLDESFSSSANDTVYALALQSDGKIVAGGDFTVFNGNYRYCTARLTVTGALDGGFASDFYDDYDEEMSVYSLELRTDGRIIVGGYFNLVNWTTTRYDIARVNSSGSVDLTFNAGAKFYGPVYSTATLQSGQILTAGLIYIEGSAATVPLVRLNSNGSRDTGFIMRDVTSQFANQVHAMADGRILLAGTNAYRDGVHHIGLVMLTSAASSSGGSETDEGSSGSGGGSSGGGGGGALNGWCLAMLSAVGVLRIVSRKR